MLAACLPLFLCSLQKIDWSWWVIFAPAYGPLYLFVVLACGLCGLRLTACRPCELLTEEATCALPVRQSSKVYFACTHTKGRRGGVVVIGGGDRRLEGGSTYTRSMDAENRPQIEVCVHTLRSMVHPLGLTLSGCVYRSVLCVSVPASSAGALATGRCAR